MERRDFIRTSATAAGLTLLLGVPAAAGTRRVSAVPAGMVRRTLPSGRTYLIRGRAAATPGPLVIGLHGTALDAANCDATFWSTGDPATTGWVKHAEQQDYTFVLGESVDGSWNVGGGWPSGGHADEQYLLDAIQDAAGSRVDAGQVFAAGFSAGGALAWRMAALHPSTVAACGMASGWAPVYPSGPIDCFHTHGTADTTIPIRGGAGVYGYVFPAAVTEQERAPRGSRAVLYPTNWGHGTAGWMAGALFDFWTMTRARP